MAKDVFVYTVIFEKQGERKTCGPYYKASEANDIAIGQIRRGSHNVKIVVEDYVDSDYACWSRRSRCPAS